ncbi:hypothetical protein [Nonomuraea dietziae]|uniref:hypothetical protein n=1 Tax=Nonomuraea dietziae TaxID=65515 RepID=UPI0031D45849
MPDKGRVRKLLARLDSMLPGELAITGTFRADKLLMLLMLIALLFAATASHQITPFMMLGVLTAFLLVKRTSLTWALPFFFGLVVLAWISYQTVGVLAGHMESIFGGIGQAAGEPPARHRRPYPVQRPDPRPGAADASRHLRHGPAAGRRGTAQAAAARRLRQGRAGAAVRPRAGHGPAELRRRDGPAGLHVHAARRLPAGRLRLLPQPAGRTARTPARRRSPSASATSGSTRGSPRSSRSSWPRVSRSRCRWPSSSPATATRSSSG